MYRQQNTCDPCVHCNAKGEIGKELEGGGGEEEEEELPFLTFSCQTTKCLSLRQTPL